MSQSANDWASPDPSKNMTLADLDRFRYQIAGALCIQIGTCWIRTTSNSIISESELRQNTFISPLPVNLCGTLALPGCQEFNVAGFRSELRQAASSDDPTGSLVVLLQQYLPTNNAVPAMLTRIPTVQAVIASAMKSI